MSGTPFYTTILNRYDLDEKQAIILFGSDWLQNLSSDDHIIYGNVQAIVQRIRKNPDYRKKLYPYFERTLKFIKKIIDKNKKNNYLNLDFRDVFNWDYEGFAFDVFYDDYEIEKFWKIYDRFRDVSGKYAKYFDEYKKEILVNESKNSEEYEEYEEYDDEKFQALDEDLDEDEEYEDEEEANDETDEENDEENDYDSEDENEQNESENSLLENAYHVLDLGVGATVREIKIRYRELTLKFHPDRNKSSESTKKMTEINNAVEMLLEHLRQGATA